MATKSKTTKKTKVKTGETLEIEVERIYRLLGATTRRRVLLDEYEIDVVVWFSKGPIEISLVVECKEYDYSTRVSDIDMRSFAVKLMTARQSGEADRGVFVTTSGYSKTALATADKYNIRCLTLEELRNQLIEPKEYVHKTLEEFAKSDLSRWYIDQTGSDIEDYDSLLEESTNKYLHTPLTNYVSQIFFEEKGKRLALLGNFGTGKTSFCLKYRDLLLSRYRADPSQRIPVLISLRDYRSGIDIHQAIAGILQKLPGMQVDLKLSLELQRMGRLFFLLDGLDEMATKVDRTVINESLREIDRLYSEGDNLYLLTCRTHFFQERIIDEFLKEYRVVYLTDWGKRELELYLQKRFGSESDKYLKQIQSVSGLDELSRTPLLLDMIVKSLSKFKEGDEISNRKLYATYTDDWILEQSKRRGAIMSAHQRRKFTVDLAVKLFTEARTGLHFSELYEVAREFSGYGDATRLDYFDTDARTCTFIAKDSKGSYGFRHKSFMEFFCSQAIVNQVNAKNSALLTLKLIPKEIIEFIGAAEMTEEGENALLQWSRDFENKNLSQNAVSILLKLGKTLPTEVEKHYGFSRTQWESLQKAVSTFDERALEEFVSTNWRELRLIAARLIRQYYFADYDPDELVNETIIRLWTKRRVIPEGINMKAYLYTVMKHLMMDRYRLARRQMSLPISDPDLKAEELIDRKDIHKELEFDELWRSVERELGTTSSAKKTKRAFIAKFQEGKTIDEIAEELNLARATVYQMIYRVRKLLQDKIQSSQLPLSQKRGE